MDAFSDFTPAQRRVLETLIDADGLTAAALSTRLDISAVAVRQHLATLSAAGLAEAGKETRGVGRPARIWRAAPGAQGSLADGHGQLSVEILNAAAEIGLLDRLLGKRTEDQRARYARQLDDAGDLSGKIRALAALRTEEGYRARAWTEEDGVVCLAENHCPLHCAVQSCMGLCTAEQNLFAELVGPDVRVERTEHIGSGDRRCVYRFHEQ